MDVPSLKERKMMPYDYLIIGSGMTAESAAHGIRDFDPKGTIAMIGKETDLPYDRPPLSKGLWKGKPLDSIWRNMDGLEITLHLGRRVVSINAEELSARDDAGNDYSAGKILLATGGKPRRLPFGGDEIIYYRTLADYRRLSKLCETGQDFVVIGGGFIGSEIAAALAMNGKHVKMIFPEDGIGARVYPYDLSQFLNDFYRQKEVTVLTGETVTGTRTDAGRIVLALQSGKELAADGVVAGIGIRPNVELAQAAGLQVNAGILVDEMLATSQPGIYAAGDVAEFFNPSLGKRLRVEHEDNANSMGRLAGRNMAGASQPYHYLPYFYSDLFELGYEAVGELDASLATVEDWQEPFRKGAVYYLRDGRLSGVLLWNLWDKIPKARKLVDQAGPFDRGKARETLDF